MELEQQETIDGEPSGGGADEAAVVGEAVAGCEDGVERLVREVGMIRRRRCRDVGQVGDDDVEASGNGRQ